MNEQDTSASGNHIKSRSKAHGFIIIGALIILLSFVLSAREWSSRESFMQNVGRAKVVLLESTHIPPVTEEVPNPDFDPRRPEHRLSSLDRMMGRTNLNTRTIERVIVPGYSQGVDIYVPLRWAIVFGASLIAAGLFIKFGGSSTPTHRNTSESQSQAGMRE